MGEGFTASRNHISRKSAVVPARAAIRERLSPQNPHASITRPLVRAGDTFRRESANIAQLSASAQTRQGRSEEHTSELQSQSNLVCRLLLEKKKIKTTCT